MSPAGGALPLLRAAFRDVAGVREVRMFGGISFLVRGHMTVAISPRGLLVRVGPDEHGSALKKPGTRVMEMRGRVMTGYLYVDPAPTDSRTVRAWVQTALSHNRTLPPKKAGRRAAPKKGKRTKTGDHS